MGCINNTLARPLNAMVRPNHQVLKAVSSPDIYLLITVAGNSEENSRPSVDKASKPPDLLLPELKIAWSGWKQIGLGIRRHGTLILHYQPNVLAI